MALNKKSKNYLIGLAGAILLPLSIFLYYNKSVMNAVKLPKFYRVDKVDSISVDGKMRYDTIYHKVNDIQLVNQLGHNVSLNNDLRGKILVINFFFTNCNTICPKLTTNIEHAVAAYKKKNTDIVQFLSISVDPNDSVSVLRQYADRYTTQHDRWWFLTGNKDSIYHYAKEELGLVLDAETPDDFIHSQQVVLVDTFRNIRGYYDGLDVNQMVQMTDDVMLLNLEKNKQEKKKK
ncbi:MAG TPA: SCO family protein [Edaphocola sp.]|nr:SCO family protein [Edaphocola sp.]